MNAYRAPCAGTGEEKEPRLPAPTARARNPAKKSALAGMETNEPEPDPINGEEIPHHFAKAGEETNLQSTSPSTPPRTPLTEEELEDY